MNAPASLDDMTTLEMMNWIIANGTKEDVKGLVKEMLVVAGDDEKAKDGALWVEVANEYKHNDGFRGALNDHVFEKTYRPACI